MKGRYWLAAMAAMLNVPARKAGPKARSVRGMSYPRNCVRTLAAPIEPYGLAEAHPERKSRKFAIVTNAIMNIRSPAKLALGMALEPSIGMKDMAKTKIEKERIGAALKINRFASCGTISSLVRSFMKSASG